MLLTLKDKLGNSRLTSWKRRKAFITSHLVYPQSTVEGLEGEVQVQLVLSKTGSSLRSASSTVAGTSRWTERRFRLPDNCRQCPHMPAGGDLPSFKLP